ncbi:MAG: hypothetical protein QG640_479 [Patescibacteria group bacterium]|nr:hypothetical protein [Patescibacteria group bacterium]
MDNKKIPTSIGAIVLVIIAITAGMFVWVYEKGQGWDTEIVVMQLKVAPKEAEKTDLSESELKTPISEPEHAKPIVFEPFEKWATYKNEVIGIEIRYPHELFLNTKDSTKITFDYLSPNDLEQTKEYATLAEMRISLEEGSVDKVIKERTLERPLNLKQQEITLNNVTAQQLTYTSGFDGGTMYQTYIPNGRSTIVIWYAGDNQLENTFNRILSTIRYSK